MSVEGFVITEGNTVQEAVSKALRMLQVKKEQTTIEIISEGKQGFLGVGSRLAKVKVSIKEDAKAELELTDILVDLHIRDESLAAQYSPKVTDKMTGVAAVVNGKVVVTDPSDLGSYAILKPGRNMRLIINGQETVEETPVSEGDMIQVELVDEKPVSSLELTVADNKLEALLRLVSQPGATYRLMDQAETNKLLLQIEVAEIIESPPVTVEDVIRFLQEKNVVKGILNAGIQQVLENQNGKEGFPVARGLKPEDGIDAYIRLPFLDDAKEDEEEPLFNHHQMVSVSPGEVVAIKVPKQIGRDGWAVTGEPIPAALPKDCEMCIKSGCEFTGDGEMVVATIAGRPGTANIGNKTFVHVDPVYEVKDVDQTIGNIKFAGDVLVRGSVRDGYKIEADGNIEVFGDVTRAAITAGASVTIHQQALGSIITAGGRAALYSSILPGLKETGEMLNNVRAVAEQLKSVPAFKTSDLRAKGDGPLIQLLLDSKFNVLPQTVSELSETMLGSKQTVHEQVLDCVNLLQKDLCGLGSVNIESVDYLQRLKECVDLVVGLINDSIRKEDCIKVKYVQNCTLQSSGDVIIEGQGCYISTITAGGVVIVSGNPGVARGVKVVSNGNVTVKELGSDFDTQTSVAVNCNSKVSAGLIHPNVTVKVGGDKFRVDNLYKNFDAYINYEGQLVVDKLLTGEKRQ